MTRWQLAQLLRALLRQNGTEPPPPVPPPTKGWFCITAAEMMRMIPGRACPRDSHYWAADADTCNDLLYQCYAAAPRYVSVTAKQRGVDCDKIAHILVSFFYRRGYQRVWEVWGMTPDGPHAWNVIDNADGRFETEPQECDIWAFGSNPHYRIMKWVVPRP